MKKLLFYILLSAFTVSTLDYALFKIGIPIFVTDVKIDINNIEDVKRLRDTCGGPVAISQSVRGSDPTIYARCGTLWPFAENYKITENEK